MRTTWLLEMGVAVATALSIGLLAIMLASPWLPQATDAPPPLPSVSPQPSATPQAEEPPIGLYLLRGPFSFGPCLALELTAESYPVAEDAEGEATVLWWQRGMTGCDARTGEVQEASASVARDLAEDDGHLIGYAVDFMLPLDGDPEQQSIAAQITILAAQSTTDLLQALETSAGASGFGMVLDRVPAVDPPLNPLPSAAPVAFEPKGLFLLQGPFDGDGPCLVIELTDASYPADPSVEGTALVRWWERAAPDPDDPAQCLRRGGEIREEAATLIVTIRGSSDLPAFYGVNLSLPLSSDGEPEEVDFVISTDESTVDQLHATVVRPSDVPPLVFDRVDSIDPPLGPAP